jgi:hypothetical protein
VEVGIERHASPGSLPDAGHSADQISNCRPSGTLSRVSTVHTVRTSEVTVEVELDCDYCGYAGLAEVRSSGTGTATSVVFFDRAHARRVAAEEALADVQHQARVTAALLPCPQCRRRSRVAVVHFTVMTALGVLALCAGAVVGWWIQTGFWRLMTPAIALAVAIALIWTKRKRFIEIESLLESVRLRAKLPPAAAVKVGPARKPITPVATKAPEPRPADDDAPREPKLLG